MFESIPQELKFNGLWCCWRKTQNGKVPFDVLKETYAKSNDKSTFYSFKTILNNLNKYLKQDEKGAFIGGLGLGIFNGFSAVDIDHCIDENGNISDMAKEIIDYCQSYTEKSPSGTGIRIIFKTDFKDFDKKIYYTNNHKGLEVYIEGTTNKFVTITGNTLLSCDVANVDIKYILDKYMLKDTKKENKNEENKNLNKNFNIINFIDKDKKLNKLWNSVASGSGGNESETDLALCSKLAFYLQKDKDLINEAFTKSPYFQTKDETHRKKWLDREDYRDATLQKAIDGCSEVYSQSYQNKRYDLNDTGNAHRFVDRFGAELKYNIDNKCWMIWNDKYWQYDVFKNVKNYAEILGEEMKLEAYNIKDSFELKEMNKNINRLFNSNGKEAMLKEAQHINNIPVNNDMFDKQDMLLNCENGVLDLNDGDLLQHNKNLLLSKSTCCDIIRKEPTHFIKFLHDLFTDDVIDYLQRALGYSMTGSTEEQKLFILTGDGSNGKSLFIQIIREVLGDYATVSSSDLLLDKKTQSSNLSEVARLKGIRFVAVNELKMGDKLNESGVKDITGGNNEITARFLYANEFTFLPKMKIWLATNYEPNIRGTDNGIWRRIVKIPFNKTFSESEQDRKLIYKLREEKSQILYWLLEGCLKWQKRNLDVDVPELLTLAKKEYKTTMDIVQQWIDENCELDNSYITRSADLYENFKNFCVKNGEFQFSQTMFSRNFGKKFSKNRYQGIWCYYGVRLKNNI